MLHFVDEVFLLVQQSIDFVICRISVNSFQKALLRRTGQVLRKGRLREVQNLNFVEGVDNFNSCDVGLVIPERLCESIRCVVFVERFPSLCEMTRFPSVVLVLFRVVHQVVAAGVFFAAGAIVHHVVYIDVFNAVYDVFGVFFLLLLSAFFLFPVLHLHFSVAHCELLLNHLQMLLVFRLVLTFDDKQFSNILNFFLNISRLLPD